MTWYIDPKINAYYWLIENKKHPTAESYPTLNELIRVIEPTDKKMGSYAGLFKGNHINYSAFLPEGAVPMVDFKFPAIPSYENLKLLPSGTIEPGITLLQDPPYNTYLGVQKLTVITWSENTQTFWTPSVPSHLIVEAYKKYAGRNFEVDTTNYLIRPKNGNWYEIMNDMIFDVETLKFKNEKEYNFELNGYKRIEKLIQDYINWITPETILDTYSYLTPNMWAPTNCNGCRHLDSSHLIVHLHRKELPLVLMSSLYNLDIATGMIGVWRLIESLKMKKYTELSNFKEKLKVLLEGILLPKNILMTKEQEQDLIRAHPWGRHLPLKESKYNNAAVHPFPSSSVHAISEIIPEPEPVNASGMFHIDAEEPDDYEVYGGLVDIEENFVSDPVPL